MSSTRRPWEIPSIESSFESKDLCQEQVDSLIIRPESSKEFGEWMAGLYGDVAPSQDSNSDGITFAQDFGFGADTWETVGTALPSDSSFKRFLQTLFKEYLITQ